MGQISAAAVTIASASFFTGDEAGADSALSTRAEEDDMDTKNLRTSDTDSPEY
jgi:hypothetical protein